MPKEDAYEPIRVQATGMSLRSDTVTVGHPFDGGLGLVVRTGYGVATAWLTPNEAKQVADALIAQAGKTRKPAFVPRPISFERWSEMMREVAPTITDQQLRVLWDDAQQWGEAMRQATEKPDPGVSS